MDDHMTIKIDNTPVRCRGEALSEVWWEGRQWAVTSYGLERRDGTYQIEKARLFEGQKAVDQNDKPRPYSWIQHICGGKSWADMDDFATALFVGIAMHGYRLPKREVALLQDHFRAAKEKRAEYERMAPYRARAREEILGPPDSSKLLAFTVETSVKIDERARDLARNDGI